jgi:hypothetical protein
MAARRGMRTSLPPTRDRCCRQPSVTSPKKVATDPCSEAMERPASPVLPVSTRVISP